MKNGLVGERLTFNEIMSYDLPRNYEIFTAIVKQLKIKQLVPFVGAGLSTFLFKSWVGFLSH